MISPNTLSRRSFLATAGAAAVASAAYKRVPVGLELYSVREELKKDPIATVRAVGKMGYECVEFFSPYMQWSTDQAKEMRKVMDDVKLRCYSTHNGASAFTPENIEKIIELNKIIGSKYVVMASAGRVADLDGWKKVAETLTTANETLKKSGLRAGFHNHQVEFKPIDGKRPIEVLAENTPKDVVLQLDVGTVIEAGSDPVAWINQNPGRIKSIHVKEYSRQPGKGYRVLFGEGDANWKDIMTAAEKTGGVEYYLIEQEGADTPELETAQKCLEAFRKMRSS